jgi:hypothetical protein
MTERAVPVLPAIDIRDTIFFYETKLGFLATNYGVYAIMTKGDIQLHFFECRDPELCKNPGCYIYVNNIEDLYAKLSVLDIIHPNGKLEERSWGMKEFSVTDNNGNVLRFGEDASH